METGRLKNNNGTYLYKDEGFNTVRINLNFLVSTGNRSAAIVDVLGIYLTKCNQVYKTEDDIVLKTRELYDMSLDFRNDWEGKNKIFTLSADFISMDAAQDDYSTEAFEFIRDMLKKPDFNNEEVLELAKKEMLSYIDFALTDMNYYAANAYRYHVLPVDYKEYDYSLDREYFANLIDSITLEDIKNEYENLISNYICGFAYGNISEELFNKFVECMDLTPTVKDLDFNEDVKTAEEDIEIDKECEQTYIFVTYDFTDASIAEVRLLEKMLDSTLGLCYQTLREKYGLVYGAYADVLFHEKKLYFYGETDYAKKDKFIEACDEIVKALCDKTEVEKYMEVAKKEIEDDEYSLSENKKKMVRIINNNILKVYGDQDREETFKEIQEMKPEEIMDKAKTLKRKNVFMVRGKSNE